MQGREGKETQYSILSDPVNYRKVLDSIKNQVYMQTNLTKWQKVHTPIPKWKCQSQPNNYNFKDYGSTLTEVPFRCSQYRTDESLFSKVI